MPLMRKVFLSVQRPMRNNEKELLLIDPAAVARSLLKLLGASASWPRAVIVADVTS